MAFNSLHCLDENPEDWGFDEVAEWLESVQLGRYSDYIARTHRIDGPMLLLLTENDLRSAPLSLSVLGDIKRLGLHIEKLRKLARCHTNAAARERLGMDAAGRSESHLASNGSLLPNGGTKLSPVEQMLHDGDAVLVNECHQCTSNRSPRRNGGIPSSPSQPDLKMIVESPDTPSKSFWKTVIASVYCLLSILITSFVMVIVHDRVPDMKTYPPLPDLVLDNVPLIPWAFQLCEILACTMGLIWTLLLLFHKHRSIIFRRSCSLLGTVFLLRCITMLITSLSVPGVHLECAGKVYGDFGARLKQAFYIWTGMGLSIKGVRTCGDYMFSGHTVAVTLLNHFITEYTPEDWHHLHTATWVMNLFGIFFILAAHEHYSIDVFVAFYITSRLFIYYHTLAHHAQVVTKQDSRTRVFFPLFWFFESGGEVGRVPNEYEWPIPSPGTIRDFCTMEPIRKLLTWELFSMLPRKSKNNSDSIRLSDSDEFGISASRNRILLNSKSKSVVPTIEVSAGPGVERRKKKNFTGGKKVK